MGNGKCDGVELTQEQRRLVSENVGLVGVHIRRSLGHLPNPKRDREWDDLFQEGCLGLIQAAVIYREERGIPFAAFALPRIHNAVSRALATKFSTVQLPIVRRSSRGCQTDENEPHNERMRPIVYSLSDELERNLPDRPHRDLDGAGGETIGDRLRAKYERAVQEAVDAEGCGPSRRGDRDKLARVIAEERFLVPSEESRTALRRIARQTDSSYARVAQCDKKLGSEVRNRLEVDPEFRELSRRARTHPLGTDLPIDAAMDFRLNDVASTEFIERLHKADPRTRAQCFDILSRGSQGTLDAILKNHFSTLAPVERERLFHHLRDMPG